MMKYILFSILLALSKVDVFMNDGNFLFLDTPLLCTEELKPAYCGFPNVTLSTMLTLSDFENCGPGVLPIHVRNYIYGISGTGSTYLRNMRAFEHVAFRPRMLRDVSNVDLSTTVLGARIPFPLGVSPTAAHKLVHPVGEIGTARGAIRGGGLMILSSSSNVRMEDIAASVCFLRRPNEPAPVLWMQTYMYKNPKRTLSIMRRAKAAGFKAIVVTADSPVGGESNCQSKAILYETNLTFPNLVGNKFLPNIVSPSRTFEDLNWTVRSARLPVVAKGLLTGDDAVRAARAGVSAIMVSNHGGRQLDGVQATLDALQDVVEALRRNGIDIEVYMDGGVRSGRDIYKAMARGARAVFVGRPALWALAIAGEEGVYKMMKIMHSEFNQTMMLSGTQNVKEISGRKIVNNNYYK